LSRTVENITVGLYSHPVVINARTGKYVAHTEIDKVREGLSIYDDAAEGMKPLLDTITQGVDIGTGVYYDEVRGEKFAVAYQAVFESDWVVI
jgi:methyl-accepting chemotaxis protein